MLLAFLTANCPPLDPTAGCFLQVTCNAAITPALAISPPLTQWLQIRFCENTWKGHVSPETVARLS